MTAPASGGRADGRGRSVGERLVVAASLLLCLVFVSGLRDVGRAASALTFIPAPMLPADVGERDATLAVTVLDEAGHAVVGASARVFAIRDGTAYFAGERTTDGAGLAAFDRLPRGEAWILAYGPRRSRASARAILESGSRDQRLVLHVAKALDVVVVDEADKPIAGATVEVRGADPLPYVGVTDQAGGARIDRLGPAPFVVRARAPTYEEALRTGVVPGAAPLRLRLERLGAIAVTVVDAAGKPAPKAVVLAAGTSLWPARSTEVDGEGKVILRGLRAGAYDLKAKLGEDVSRTEIGVLLKRGETKHVELKLGPGKRVRVKVVDGEGDPAPPVRDASVVLVEEGLSSFPLFGKTGAEGTVVLGPISLENASVSARAAGFVPTSGVRVEDKDTDATVVLHKGALISGDVVDDRGYPIAGATIEVVGVDAAGMPIDETGASTEFRDDAFSMSLGGPTPLLPIGELGVMPGPIPDLPHGALPPLLQGAARAGEAWVTRRDGVFRAEPVPPGRVVVIARHPAHVEGESETITVTSGGEAKVHIVLRDGGTIEGRVLEEDRTPVAGARVELSATEGGLERFTYAADDGTFTFVGVPAEVLLGVSRPETPGDVAVRMLLHVPDGERARVEIVLPKLRDSVHVRTRDDRGYPVDRVEVHAVALDATVALRKTIFTNADGEAELPDAAGLPLRLTFLRPGKAPHIEQIDPAPTQVDVTLADGVRAHGEITGRGGRDRLEGADVTVITPWGTRRTKTGRDGDFELTEMAPGRVRVRAFADGYAMSEEVVTIAGDRDHDADLGKIDLPEAGEIEGQVVDEHDDPVRGARVGVAPVATWLPIGPLPKGVVLTNRDGEFTLVGMPDGAVTIEAYSPSEGRGSADVEVMAQRTTRRVKIALAGADGATAEPKGAGGVAVSLAERDVGRRTLVEVLSVAPNSEAELAGLEPGDTIVSVNGHEVRAMDIARRRMSGPLAEDVVIGVERDGAPAGAAPWLVRVRRERVHR
jgi:hypothetical protein